MQEREDAQEIHRGVDLVPSLRMPLRGVLRRGRISSSRHADQRPCRLALKDVLGAVPAVPRFIRHAATIELRAVFLRRRTVADIERGMRNV